MSDASEEKVSMIETVKIVWRLFTNSDRVAFIRIVFMVIIGMFLETVSLGIVVPIIGILTQVNYPWIFLLIVVLCQNANDWYNYAEADRLKKHSDDHHEDDPDEGNAI